MADSNFVIRKVNGAIILEDGGYGLAISQTMDSDLWFTASLDEETIEISMDSRNRSEWQTYMVFENLMKALVGRFMLSGDYKDEYSLLPSDFIDLENNTITWHSDGGTANSLRLSYDERVIRISVAKSKDAYSYYTNTVRIRTSGSNYDRYYEEFLSFFRALVQLEERLNKTAESGAPMQRKRANKKMNE